MKKFLTIAAIAAATLIACSESDSDLIGRNPSLVDTYWEYDAPVCEFEYSADSIVITTGMQGEKMSFAPEEIVALYNSFAGEKMEAYMRYFHFVNNNTMNVGYVKDGEDGQISITYSQVDKYLSVDLKAVNPNIPAISANYTIINEGDERYMEIYFEKIFITMMAQQMLPTMLPSVMPNIIPNYSTLPEIAQQAIIASFTTQINQILANTETLKVGLRVIESEIK